MFHDVINVIAGDISEESVRPVSNQTTDLVVYASGREIDKLQARPIRPEAEIGVVKVDKVSGIHEPNLCEHLSLNQHAACGTVRNLAGLIEGAVILATKTKVS